MTDQSWIKFWEESAENANEAIRLGNILPDGTLACEEDNVFHSIFTYYLKNLHVMDREMQKRVTSSRMTVYRNFFNDIYFEVEEGDEILHKCFTSCSTEKFNSDYGDYKSKISIPKGTPCLQHDNLIILPPGTFRLVKRNGIQYILEMTSSLPLFQNENRP